MLGCIGSVGRAWRAAPDVTGPPWKPELRGLSTVKKLFLVALLGLSAFAVWRKVQADRAELNLWTEATTADD